MRRLYDSNIIYSINVKKQQNNRDENIINDRLDNFALNFKF